VTLGFSFIGALQFLATQIERLGVNPVDDLLDGLVPRLGADSLADVVPKSATLEIGQTAIVLST